MMLTDEQRAVLADVVVDPDKWVADAIAGKVGKHRDEYEQRKAAMGANYKNRAERQAEEDAALRAKVLADLADQQARREAEEREAAERAEEAKAAEAEMIARITEQVKAGLAQ